MLRGIFGLAHTGIALGCAFYCLLYASPVTAKNTMSLKQARAILYERSDALKGASAKVENKEQEQEAVKFLGGPTITAQATELWGETRIDVDKSVTTPAGNMPVDLEENYNFSGPRASISGTWPIYTGGKIQSAQRASKFAVDEAKAKRSAISIDLDTDLIAKYFGLQLAVSIQKLREHTLSEQNRELERALKFEKQGMISPLERMSVQVSRDTAEREALKAKDAKRIALLQLQRLLRDETFGRLTTPLFIVRSDIGAMEQWVSETLTNNPRIAELEAKVQQANQGVEAARGNWAPEVFAFGQYSFIRHYQTAIEPMWLAGLGINLTLWDSRDRLATFRSARGTLREARSAHMEVVNQMRTAVETAWIRTQNAREQYKLTDSTARMARENLRLKTEGFGEGLCTALDMTEARNQLIAAEVERRVAAYEFVTNYAVLHAIAGKMEDFMNPSGKTILHVEDAHE